VKQKILLVVEVECLGDDSRRWCSPRCPYYPSSDRPNVCQVLGDELELADVGEDGFRRHPRCFAAAGNYNILSKFMAGE